MELENHEGNTYALLIGVGDCSQMDLPNLAAYKNDVALMEHALIYGIKIPKEHIRCMLGEHQNGTVTAVDFARVMAHFQNSVREEDLFILYFSGHGDGRHFVFSSQLVSVQSVIAFMDELCAKTKIVIMDCCYAGNFDTDGAKQMSVEMSVAEFVGHGIAVFASSSKDERARFGMGGTSSLYTEMMSLALTRNKRMRKGRISLQDIHDEITYWMNIWNREHPDKVQHPIYRQSMGGTVYFQVEEYAPYEKAEFHEAYDRYKIVKVEPLSTNRYKRLSASVVTDEEAAPDDLSGITKEIAERIKYEDIYAGPNGERRFKGTSARAVWCYFGCDESDMVNHLHYAYTIWAADNEMRELYFREYKYASVVDGIYVWQNASYHMLKNMQKSQQTREEFVKENKHFLASFVSLSEQFIVDMQEVANRTMSTRDMQKEYGAWMREVYRQYRKLSDGELAPDDLHDWLGEIMNLAGFVVDMALLLENERGGGEIGEREIWLIRYAVKGYYESLERIKAMEEVLGAE